MRNRLAVATLVLGTLAFTLTAAGHARAQTDCESARCAVQAAVNDQCSCTDATNHGQYVSCVAHVVNQLARDGTVPKNCKGKVTRCAARSVCGKTGFVTCNIPQFGTCGTPCTADPATTCCEDATTACTTDTDCVVGSKCKIKSSADRCTALSGTVGTSPTCCPDCTQ